jgi:tripartite-type tricarboxylate transporter receptor subunit TctC
MALAVGALAIALNVSSVQAQTYPEKPIRIITSSVGGGGDLASRIIAQGVADTLGQPIVVENLSSSAASENVAQAEADGYTALVTGSSFWIGPLLRQTSYDPKEDFRPITIISQASLVVVANPSLPVNNIAELIALAKEKPGTLNYGSGTPGGGTHLAGEMFKSMTETDIVNIPFSDDADLLQALLSGDLELAWVSSASVAEQVQAGNLKVLATTGPNPSALYPDAPVVAATVPGYVSVSMTAMFVPAGTPDAVVTLLSETVSTYLRTDAARDLFRAQGVESIGSTSEELASTMQSEMERLAALIEKLDLREK